MSDKERRTLEEYTNITLDTVLEDLGINKKYFYSLTDEQKLSGKEIDYIRASFVYRLCQCSKNKTMGELARQLSVSSSSVWGYKSGNAEPKAITLARIAGHFGVSADYLLGFTDISKPNMEERDVLKYTGLSERAGDKLNAGRHDKRHPLYSSVASYLIEYGFFDTLVHTLERSLIEREQYAKLFGTDDAQRQNTLETQEYQFNKQLSSLYSNVVTVLSQQLSDEITKAAEQQFFNMVDGAIETKEKMEQIIDAALSDPAKLDEYNRRHQTFE